MKHFVNKSTLFILVACLCLLPFVTPAMALVAGALMSFIGVRHERLSGYTSFLLQASIVLMGFGMNLTEVISASVTGFSATAISVIMVIAIGLLLGKIFKVDDKISMLIACGTAICGGSAIAAVAPVIRSRHHQISFALAVVFVLNAIALLVFPVMGHYLNMSQEAFGYWAAIAIHDTSSVVGAGAAYGDEALKIATTIKLVRALWIIPVTLVLSFFMRDKEAQGKVKIPWFIGLFVLAIVFAYYVPQLSFAYSGLKYMGKQGMVLALFLIGSKISLAEMREAGPRSFALGILLWLIISLVSLFFILT
ncbi:MULTISPECIES: YeiH family protein [unclassified Carboxylicivirga]|uniref:YeiH family protein n=1 Tax=Carboxylicivirga TaxID=1628153 RepID=UPI003D344710